MTETTDTKSTPPRILSLIPAEPGWVATVHYYEKDDEGRRTVTNVERRTVHGWALVENEHGTSFEPMYVEPGGFPACQSLYNSYAPDLVDVRAHYEPGATDLTDPRTDKAIDQVEAERADDQRAAAERFQAIRALAYDALGYVQAQQSDPALYDMLSALCRALDGDDGEAVTHLYMQRAETASRGALADRQRKAWGFAGPRIDRGGFEVPLDANGDTAFERAAKADGF